MSPIKETIDRSDLIKKVAAIPQKLAGSPAKPTGAAKAPGRGNNRRKNRPKKNRLSSIGSGIQRSPATTPTVKFAGECKKELDGVVIIWHPDVTVMSKRFGEFARSVGTVAGNISPELGTSIDDQEKLCITSFAPKKNDESLWTKGDGSVDEHAKDFLTRLGDNAIKIAGNKIEKYNNDWARRFSKILGQLCPETQAHLTRFKEWQPIADERDPGKLLRLLQLVCFGGSGSAYPIETCLNALTEVVTRRQGHLTPSE